MSDLAAVLESVYLYVARRVLTSRVIGFRYLVKASDSNWEKDSVVGLEAGMCPHCLAFGSPSGLTIFFAQVRDSVRSRRS